MTEQSYYLIGVYHIDGGRSRDPARRGQGDAGEGAGGELDDPRHGERCIGRPPALPRRGWLVPWRRVGPSIEDEDGGDDRNRAPKEPSWEECMELLDQLPALPHEQRVAAIERLIRNSSPVIRERALRTGAAVVSDERLESYLREEADDVLRNAGLEMLKMRGDRELSRWRSGCCATPTPTSCCRRCWSSTTCATCGRSSRCAPCSTTATPTSCRRRSWPSASSATRAPSPTCCLSSRPTRGCRSPPSRRSGDLRSPAAVAPLGALLPDLMVGPLAAEALARIGGGRAFQRPRPSLAALPRQLDAETMLGLLAHVLEGLGSTPPAPAGAARVAGRALARRR